MTTPTNKPKVITDPILVQIEQGIGAAVPGELKAQYNTMVDICLGLAAERNLHPSAFSGNTKKVSSEVANIVVQAHSDISRDKSDDEKVILVGIACGFASMTLMAHVLDQAKRTGKLKLNNGVIARCAQETSTACLTKFGITEEMVAQVISAGALGQQSAHLLH